MQYYIDQLHEEGVDSVLTWKETHPNEEAHPSHSMSHLPPLPHTDSRDSDLNRSSYATAPSRSKHRSHTMSSSDAQSPFITPEASPSLVRKLTLKREEKVVPLGSTSSATSNACAAPNRDVRGREGSCSSGRSDVFAEKEPVATSSSLQTFYDAEGKRILSLCSV